MSSIEQAFDAPLFRLGGPARPGIARGPGRPTRRRQASRSVPAVPAVRLTRRGRLLLHGGTALLLVAGAIAGVLGFGGDAFAGDQVHSVPVSYHDVLPGETLWAIAVEVEPQTDPRETIARIVELNALDDEALVAGQRLALPAG